MKHDETEVHAQSVWEGDDFTMILGPDGRPIVRHVAHPMGEEAGVLRAVYVAARDSIGTLVLEVYSREQLERIFAGKRLDDQLLAREGEGFATRKMLIRLMGAPPAAVA